jgi:hypothetical membrane protein
MALLFSKPSGNGGNSFFSIEEVWLTLIGVFSEGIRLQYLLSQTVGYESKKIIFKYHNNSYYFIE